MVMLAASLAGLAVAFYAYITPLTGVTGTLGAMAVIVTCLVLAGLSLILPAMHGKVGRILLRLIILAVIVGTAFAASLLHLWWLVAAMAIALVGLIIAIFRSAPAAQPTRS